MTIGLIACVHTKQERPCMAKDMYISPFFRKGYEYLSYRCDRIFIMSAKYGLLKSDTIIAPYNKTLKDMDRRERMKWSFELLRDLAKYTDLENDQFILMGGVKYIEFISKKIPHCVTPLQDIPGERGIGICMHWLDKWNDEYKNKEQ